MRLRGSDILIAVIAGVLLGAIVHVAIILRVPNASRSDAFSRHVLLGSNGEAQLIPAVAGRSTAMGDDPATARGACAWNLHDGPIRIVMPSTGLVQTLSIHDRSGRIIYSLSDRAAVRGSVTLTVMTAAQQEERRLTQADDADDDAIAVISGTDRGLAVVRAVVASPAWRERATSAVLAVTCTPEE